MLFLLDYLLLLECDCALELEFLLHRLAFVLLLTYDVVTFEDFLLALLQLFLHFINLTLINPVGLGQLASLLLQRGDKHLRLLNDLLFVFHFALQRLVKQ